LNKKTGAGTKNSVLVENFYVNFLQRYYLKLKINVFLRQQNDNHA